MPWRRCACCGGSGVRRRPCRPRRPTGSELSAWLSHRLLYAFILILPIIGWLGSSAFGAPVHIYGLFDFPALIGPDKSLANILFAIHIWGAFALAALVVLHIGAAFYHLLVRRDSVFRRMVG